MTVDNGENRNKNKNFDEKHRFVKGNTVSRGKRKRTDTEKLRLALERAGKKQAPPIEWWDKVAEKAFLDKDIMKAVLNKLVPTVSELTGLGGEPALFKFIIERNNDNEGSKNKTDS